MDRCIRLFIPPMDPMAYGQKQVQPLKILIAPNFLNDDDVISRKFYLFESSQINGLHQWRSGLENLGKFAFLPVARLLVWTFPVNLDTLFTVFYSVKYLTVVATMTNSGSISEVIGATNRRDVK